MFRGRFFLAILGARDEQTAGRRPGGRLRGQRGLPVRPSLAATGPDWDDTIMHASSQHGCPGQARA